jgi:iron(III) transport system ATP-binding protein
MTEAAFHLHNVSKRFATHPAVVDINLSLEPGEVLSLLGPSGCGKTTVLRLIAGFERADAGSIHIAGRLVADGRKFIPPEHRGVGMVFQDYALFPHLSVAANVAFGLRRDADSSARQRVDFMLKLVGLDSRKDDFPHQLSGGEKQRVALARALLPQPVLLLLDEPLSSLDAEMRLKVRQDLRVILKTSQVAALFVTHDQEEALYLGDRVAVMNKGRVEQVGTPEQIFHEPKTGFVAEFLGGSEFLPGRVTENGIETEIGVVVQGAELPVGTQVDLVIRPDDVHFEPDSAAGSLILSRHFRGTSYLYRLRLPSGRLLHAAMPHHRRYPLGARVRVRLDADHPLAWLEK